MISKDQKHRYRCCWVVLLGKAVVQEWTLSHQIESSSGFMLTTFSAAFAYNLTFQIRVGVGRVRHQVDVFCSVLKKKHWIFQGLNQHDSKVTQPRVRCIRSRSFVFPSRDDTSIVKFPCEVTASFTASARRRYETSGDGNEFEYRWKDLNMILLISPPNCQILLTLSPLTLVLRTRRESVRIDPKLHQNKICHRGQRLKAILQCDQQLCKYYDQ